MGDVQVSTTADVTLPNGPIKALADELAEVELPQSVPEAQSLLESAAGLLVQPVSASFRVRAAVGVSDRVEIAVGSSLNAVRGQIRWQLFATDVGFYTSVGIGASRSLYAPPLDGFTDAFELRDWRRRELDFPVQLGFSHDLFHLWLGPKLVRTHYLSTVRACISDNAGVCEGTLEAAVSGTAWYAGGQLGLALGWKRFWIAAEITYATLHVRGRVLVQGEGLEDQAALTKGGRVLTPAAGFLLRI